MNEYLSYLEYYGYTTPEVDYDLWKDTLENYVSAGGANAEKDQEQHALMPLYHFCVNDLPLNTRAPELDDSNTMKILKADAEWTGVDESGGYGIGRENVGKLLSYLVRIGFIAGPSGKGRKLPELQLSDKQLAGMSSVGGRGAAR